VRLLRPEHLLFLLDNLDNFVLEVQCRVYGFTLTSLVLLLFQNGRVVLQVSLLEVAEVNSSDCWLGIVDYCAKF
jgi:hypothetical protein